MSRRGFTLIEVLVVIVIIGILASVVMVSVNGLGDKAAAENEADYVFKLLKSMPEQAIIAKKEIGFNMHDNMLSFVTFDESSGTWQAYSQEYKLDGRVKAETMVDGVKISNNTSGKPLAVFYSSGEITPFSIRLGDDKAFIIKTSGAGDIVLQQEK